MSQRLVIPTLLALLAACGGTSEPAPVSPTPAAEPVSDEPNAEPATAPADADAAAKAKQAKAEKAKAEAEQAEKAEKVKKALAELEADTAKEAARWTDALHKKTAALTGRGFKSTKSAMAAILKSPHRMPGHTDRDRYRHPTETLSFFGIKPGMTVVEMGAGEGWYTELLAPLVGPKGQLIVISPDPDGPLDSNRTVYARRTAALLGKSTELFGNAHIATFDPPGDTDAGVVGQADVVVAAREMHGWQRRGAMAAYLGAVHAMLKDGGVFAVEQHRANADADPKVSAEKGYLPEAWLIAQVEAAGFKLAAKSEINANPKDSKDYPKGVWTLPPNFTEGETDKAKYTAIGESDRMTLKFTKVAAP